MLKKQKILVGICTPMAALGAAAGLTSVLLVQNKNKSTNGDFKLSFTTDSESRFVDDTGIEQNVYSGTTLDRVNKPQVQSYRKNFMFTGWEDEQGNPVPGQYKILRDSKLKAAFADTTTGDYATVTFKSKSTEKDVKLHGNVSVAVKKGYLFMMINRPTAEWGNNYFNNWQRWSEEDNDYVDMTESYKIEKDIVLYPKFTKAVTVTWNPGKGGMILRGQGTTTLSAGTKFDSFNQPQLFNSDLTLKFSNWCSDENCTKDIDKNTIISEDTTVYAKWVPSGVVQEGYHMLSYEKSTEASQAILPDPIFSPSNTSMVLANKNLETPEASTEWQNVAKPTVSTEDASYEVESWEYLVENEKDPDLIEQGWKVDTWHPISANHKFVNFKRTKAGADTTITSTRIRPVMKSSVTGISISGESTVLPESETNYTAIVTGTSANPYVSQNVTWGVYFDEDCETPVTEVDGVSISTSGKLKVDSLTDSRYYYIKATSIANPSIYTVKQVYLEMPYVKSQKIWYHNGTQWFSISQKDGLCVGNSPIYAYALNSSYGEASQTLVRSSEFTNKLFIGRQLTTLYDQFGFNWTGFNGEIDLGDSNVTKIGGSFLEGCTNFNQKLDLSKVVEIGPNFLYNCTSFGAADGSNDPYITLGNNLTAINNNFLGGCTSYNKPLTLPNVALTIGDGFLYNCIHFNKDITIPKNIAHIEDFFMMNCNDFTSTITVNCPTTNFVENFHNISSTSSGADIFVYGFTVEGSSAATFMAAYPTHSANDSYRKIKNSMPEAKAVTKAVWDAAVAKTFSGDYSASNFTVSTPTELSGATIKVNNDTIYNLDDSTVQIKSGAELNNTWKNYEANETTGTFDFTLLNEPLDNIMYHNVGYYFNEGFGKLGYTDGGTTDPNWTFNKTTNKYTNKVNFPCDGNNLDIEVEFDGDNFKYLTLIRNGSKITWTFNNFGSTQISVTTSDDRLNQIDTKGSDDYTAYTNTSKIYSESNPKYTYWFRNDAGIGLTTKNAIRVSLWNEDLTSLLWASSYTDLQLFDTNGVLLDNDEYIQSDKMLSDYSVQIILKKPLPAGAMFSIALEGVPYIYNQKTKCKFEYIDGPVDFSSCGWDEIINWCNGVESGAKSEAEFCAHFNVGSLDDLVGVERTIDITVSEQNSVQHKVRVIGTKHDILDDGSGNPATLTFELSNILSDSTGAGIFSTWNNSEGKNYDYRNSVLRKNLTGQGTATGTWAKTALDMLPTEIKDEIKTVNKYVYVNDSKQAGEENYEVKTYSDKLFPLTATEVCETIWDPEGTTYRYYANAEEEETLRIKKTTGGTRKSYWLASPILTNATQAKTVGSGTTGSCAVSSVTRSDYVCVSFAFCI